MTYPPPWPGQAVPVPRRRPVRMLVVGLVLAGLGVVGVGVVVALGVSRTADAVQEGVGFEDALLLRSDVPGSGSVQLEPGEHVVLALGEGLLRPGSVRETGAAGSEVAPFTEPEVTVTGPDGVVELEQPGIASTFSSGSLDSVSIEAFTVIEAGRYEVTVTGTDPAVTEIGVRRAIDAEGAVRTVLGLVLGGVASGFVAFVGLVLAIIGGVRRARV